jgi:uncharacterized protein HemX
MSVNKSNQAGSATSFVIIAIILVAALLGSLYFVVQRGEQARRDADASKIADQEAAKKAQDAENVANANKPVVSNPSVTPDTPATSDSSLPATGIEIDIVRVVAIGLLAGTVTSFVASRRSLKRPL